MEIKILQLSYTRKELRNIMKKQTIIAGATLLGTTLVSTGVNNVFAEEVKPNSVSNLEHTQNDSKDQLKSEITKTEGEMEKLGKDSQTLHNEAKSLEDARNAKDNEVRKTENEVTQKEAIAKAIPEKEKKKEDLEKEVKANKEAVPEKEKVEAQAKEKVQNAEKDVLAEQDKVKDLKSPEKLKEEMSQNQKEKQTVEKSVENHTNAIANETKAKEKEEARLAEVNKIIPEKEQSKQQLEDSRTASQAQKQAEINNKKQEIASTETEVSNAQKDVDAKTKTKEADEKDLAKAKEELDKQIPMLISEEYVNAVKEMLKYRGGEVPTHVMENVEKSITKLIGSEEDEDRLNNNSPLLKVLEKITESDTRKVDVTNLTEEQTKELNEYAADLYRQVRTLFGYNKDNQLVTTKETNKLGKRFADVHVATTKERAGENAKMEDSFATGHLPVAKTIHSNIPVEVGIAKSQSDLTYENGYSYYENIMFEGEGYPEYRGYNTKTMGGLKAYIYDSVAQFLYRDKEAGYGHTRNVVRGAGVRETKSQFFIGFAHTKNYSTLLVDESVINDENATLTEVPKMKGAIELVTEVAQLEDALKEHKVALKDAETVLSTKKSQLKGLQDDLKVLQSSGDEMLARIEALAKEIDSLKVEKANLEQSIPTKAQSIEAHKNALTTENEKIANLTTAYTELEKEYNKNVDLFKDFNKAVKALADAEKEQRQAEQELAKLKSDVVSFESTIKDLEESISKDKKSIEDLDSLKVKLEEARKAYKEAVDKYEAKNQEISDNEAQYKKLFDKLDELHRKLNELDRIDNIIDDLANEPLKVDKDDKQNNDKLPAGIKPRTSLDNVNKQDDKTKDSNDKVDNKDNTVNKVEDKISTTKVDNKAKLPKTSVVAITNTVALGILSALGLISTKKEDK